MASERERSAGIAGRIVGAVVGPCVTPIVDNVDVNDVAERIDVNDVAERLDVDDLLGRVDVNALLDRIDVQALIERADIDELLDRTDVIDRIVDRVVESAELEELIASSTTGMAARFLDVLRSQVVSLDQLLQGAVDRLLRRTPRQLIVEQTEPETGHRYVQPNRDIQLQDEPAGMISRLLAYLVDVFMIGLIYGLGLALFELAVETVTGAAFDPADNGALVAVSLVVWIFLYYVPGWAISGRTFGMTVLGVKVRPARGGYMDGRRAFIRVPALFLSFLLAGAGLLLGVFQRRNRCLHDFIAGTEVVYSWDARLASRRLQSDRSA